MNGWMGNLLRVNLTTKTSSIESSEKNTAPLSLRYNLTFLLTSSKNCSIIKPSFRYCTIFFGKLQSFFGRYSARRIEENIVHSSLQHLEAVRQSPDSIQRLDCVHC